MLERLAGRVTRYFHSIGVAGPGLDEPSALGNRIHIGGRTTEFIPCFKKRPRPFSDDSGRAIPYSYF